MAIQDNILSDIPQHLRQFCEVQDYNRYTARDHAVWRFIMRRQVAHLKQFAHPVYLEGLVKTGISVDHIPSIDEMNKCLSVLGWRAVMIDGLLPSAAFMEFHAHRILPIALDMRMLTHILYTPAPDIVHEAAGHAPFLSDIDYSEFLQKFGEYGSKALYAEEDLSVYEAVRFISHIKEHPKTTKAQIKAAEKRLSLAIRANKKNTELKKISRLYWWTSEYGLVGSPNHYKIFGAGLLSSMGESRSCLDNKKVKKIPLTLDAVTRDYDITRPQPQLFVTRSCLHMRQVLEEFSHHMAFKRGGAESLRQALDLGIVATAVFNSGLQVSGVFTKVAVDALDNEIYINTTGPTQLCFKDKELPGHDIKYHAHGFGSPVGRIQNVDADLELLSVDELKSHGIEIGKEARLHFLSGIKVKGTLVNILRRESKNILFTFKNCRVSDLNGEVLFDPKWGVFDMAVGCRVVSVFAGSADRDKFDTFPKKSKFKAPIKRFTSSEKKLFVLYQKVRDVRYARKASERQLRHIHNGLKKFPDEWLLRIELKELVEGLDATSELVGEMESELSLLKKRDKLFRELSTID